MKNMCTKLVPKVLTDKQKNVRVLRWQKLLEICEKNPSFLNLVISFQQSFLLLRLKEVSKTKYWDMIDNIKNRVTSALKYIP